MSHSYSARKKYQRWLKDQRDPERKEVRNAIRNGKAEKFTCTLERRPEGKWPTGRYNFKGTSQRAFVARYSSFIKFTAAVIEMAGRKKAS